MLMLLPACDIFILPWNIKDFFIKWEKKSHSWSFDLLCEFVGFFFPWTLMLAHDEFLVLSLLGWHYILLSSAGCLPGEDQEIDPKQTYFPEVHYIVGYRIEVIYIGQNYFNFENWRNFELEETLWIGKINILSFTK